jgi:hypothetical protein
MRLNPARIVASTRSGDYTFNLPGFSVVEILPLDPDQTRSIAERWLPVPEQFLESLKQLTYFDVANRPLLLTHLLLIYQRDRSLPRRPADVYHRVTRLLIEEWDRERGIKRASQYARFDPDRKREFLAALSYNLTYSHEKKAFSEGDLVQAYEEVREVFGLPSKQARKVAREIQTHNGIIAEGPGGTFEFSHLTLQEFLCAEHMVRLPGPPTIPAAHATYPAPLAVSVALSAAPGLAFARIFLGRKNLEQLGVEGTASFLRRLQQESPEFERSAALGAAMLKLFMMTNSSDWRHITEPLNKIIQFDRVLEGIADATALYIAILQEGGRLSYLPLQARGNAKLPANCDFPLPPRAALPIPLLPKIIAICGTILGESPRHRTIYIDSNMANRIVASERT